MTLKDKPLQVSRCPISPLEKSREIAPEGMKRLSHSRNDTQLWMCLAVKVKPDAIKNNISWESVMLEP